MLRTLAPLLLALSITAPAPALAQPAEAPATAADPAPASSPHAVVAESATVLAPQEPASAVVLPAGSVAPPPAAGAAGDPSPELATAPPPVEPAADKKKGALSKSLQEFGPILILLVVIAFAVARLPKVQGLGHDDAYRKRRVMNWLPLGLTYAFLYMGRYNLTVAKNELADLNLMSNHDFGTIFGIGTLVYGFSFLLNGPLTDRFGGRRTILIGAGGAALTNLLMGLVTMEVVVKGAPGPVGTALSSVSGPLFAALRWFLEIWPWVEKSTAAPSVLLPSVTMLYALNMYFQSFGAVAIVKVNAPWFHVRERGVFGAIFGILISLGIYFAYDWNGLILVFFPGRAHLVFFLPAALLVLFFVLTWLMVRDRPGLAGFADFETGDATSGETGPPDPPLKVFAMMLRNPVILTIAGVEFCSGFLRQAGMQWGKIYPKAIGIYDSFVPHHWGMLLCCAGILGGMFAGVISDHVFQSRRGPVAATLYGAMIAGSIGMSFLLGNWMLMWVLILLQLCVIGVHGMLSGTASMDFGGSRNTGIAVGIIDGFVYLGTAVMAFWYGGRLPDGEAAKDPSNWSLWPVSMIPLAVIGFLLALRVWNAKPKPKGAPSGH